MHLTIKGFPYSAFPEYSCLACSTLCNFVPLFPFLAVSIPSFWSNLVPLFPFPLFHVSHFQRNAAKTRNALKLAGVPQTRQRILAVSGLKFAILRGRVEEVLLFNTFSDCRYMPYLRRYGSIKFCNGAQMAIFASCISTEPRAARFKPAS